MSSIVTLNWNHRAAYGPRGALYTLTPLNGLYTCSRDYQGQRTLVISGVSEVGAMTAAQRDAELLVEVIENEVAAINGTATPHFAR
jgi:hypothetical protein